MSTNKKLFLSTKDYSVSGERFDLVYNEKYEMLETYPSPSATELAKYYESEVYISHTDSSRSFADKLYQIVKKFTLRKKLKLINSFRTKEKKILDIGCGTGDFLSICQQDNWEVTGVEPNEKARSLAKEKLSISDTMNIVQNIESIKKEEFDIITLWHVLEHVPDVKSYIQSIKKLLKPNGKVVVAVPNFKSYDARYYKKYWAAYDVPRHLWHFSQHAVERLFLEESMILQKTKPMWFDAFYVALLSEKYRLGKMKLLTAFLIGLMSNFKALSTKEFSSLIYVLKTDENQF